MSSLDSREQKLLLNVARYALTAAVENRESPDSLPAELKLREPGGAFVTLRIRGRLRGCIGQLESSEPLVIVVARSARSAALEDPRFDPVRPDELAEIDIELSIMSPAKEIAPGEIEAGKHGLIVSRGVRRGLLLPQVATERSWGHQRFLEETCAKAGMDREAWKDPETRIEGFTAQVFSESEFTTNERPARGRPPFRYSTST
jgi:AmmeMemoRadiSam system protein A